MFTNLSYINSIDRITNIVALIAFFAVNIPFLNSFVIQCSVEDWLIVIIIIIILNDTASMKYLVGIEQ